MLARLPLALAAQQKYFRPLIVIAPIALAMKVWTVAAKNGKILLKVFDAGAMTSCNHPRRQPRKKVGAVSAGCAPNAMKLMAMERHPYARMRHIKLDLGL